jgi:hypothetical protein
VFGGRVRGGEVVHVDWMLRESVRLVESYASGVRLMRCTKFASACFAFVTSLSLVASAQTVAPFQFLEKPGPHAVGLKVVEQYDYSRIFLPATNELGKPFVGERARPLQTLVWYPAEKSSGKPMTVQDYVDLKATETSFGKPDVGQNYYSGIGPLLKTALWAVRDAGVKAGRYPVVIYTPSFSAPSWGERRPVRIPGELWVCRSVQPGHGCDDAKYDGRPERHRRSSARCIVSDRVCADAAGYGHVRDCCGWL